MGYTPLDVTSIRGITVDDEVVFIDSQAAETIVVENLAHGSRSTIHHEVVTPSPTGLNANTPTNVL